MSKFRVRRIEYRMTNMTQNSPQNRGQELNPLHAAFSLGEYVRMEHGNAGVGRYVTALGPFLPRELMEQLCRALNAELPPPQPTQSPSPPPPEEKAKSPGMSPEMMMLMMQLMNGGEMDASSLIKLLGQKK